MGLDQIHILGDLAL